MTAKRDPEPAGVVQVLMRLDMPELLELEAQLKKRNEWIAVEIAQIEEALARQKRAE